MSVPYLMDHELTILKCLQAFRNMGVTQSFAAVPVNQMQYLIDRGWVVRGERGFALTDAGADVLCKHKVMPTPWRGKLYELTPTGRAMILQGDGGE